MSTQPRPADRIRKLVTLAASGETNETAVARAKAREAIAAIDTELLDTLAGQRKRLLEELRTESHRLFRSDERATKTDTGELVSSALVLFQHYERVDALIAAVMLLRIETGRSLTDKERQQLDGPVEGVVDRWFAAARERRQAKREQDRARRKRKAHERRAAQS